MIKIILLSLLFTSGCMATNTVEFKFPMRNGNIASYYHSSADTKDSRKIKIHVKELADGSLEIDANGEAASDANVEALANTNAALLEMTKTLAALVQAFKP